VKVRVKVGRVRVKGIWKVWSEIGREGLRGRERGNGKREWVVG